MSPLPKQTGMLEGDRYESIESSGTGISWIAERNELNDFGEYRNGDKVNRANIIDEGVLKRFQLSVNGNVKLRELLVEAEGCWYGDPITYHKDARERAGRRSNQNSPLRCISYDCI